MTEPIIIGKPYITEQSNSASLCAEVLLGGERQILRYTVESQYKSYLTDERADAFVVGILTYAMRIGADIICRAPLSKHLHYQLTHYLIPSMAAHMDSFHNISLQAEVALKPLPKSTAVATGWTGGVDCLFTLLRTLNAPQIHHRLTHLMITSNGSLEDSDNTGLLHALVEKAKNGVGKELGLQVVGIDTNIQELVHEHFLSVVPFRYASSVLALQKLFSIYYNSATYDFASYAFDEKNAGYYELFVLNNVSTENTTFYSGYGAFSRAQKLEQLSNEPLAWRYLHPCIEPLPEKNCGHCGKCVRTIAALHGLGSLENFGAVFDLPDIKENMDHIIANVLANNTSQHYAEALALMKQGGIEISEKAQRMARIIQAAKKTAELHRKQLLTEEQEMQYESAFGHSSGI